MARYADIDVLLEHLTASDEGNFRTAITQWLEMHQVEDVAPVIHAHAEHVETDGSEELHFHWYRCSECKHALDKWDNYCKHCGAIMDEEVDHGTT